LDKRRLIKIGTVITGSVAVMSLGVRYVIPLYLAYKFSIESGISDTIGIIGGADGPTVIYYGIQPDTTLITIITIVFGLLSIPGIIYLVFNKKVIK